MKKTSAKGKILKKADSILQDYIRAKHKEELCWGCGEKQVTVGHHFVTKKNSNALRYYLPNIIPLCRDCHCLIHTQPHLIEPKIVLFLGATWYEDLMETKRQGVEVNMEWCNNRVEEMQSLLNTLKEIQ